MACEVQVVSFGFRHLKNSHAGLRPQKIDMQNTRPGKDKDPYKDKCSRKDRVAEDRDSEFRIQR